MDKQKVLQIFFFPLGVLRIVLELFNSVETRARDILELEQIYITGEKRGRKEKRKNVRK